MNDIEQLFEILDFQGIFPEFLEKTDEKRLIFSTGGIIMEQKCSKVE